MSPSSESNIFIYADFDLEAVCRRASTLRQGISCTFDPASTGLYFILFGDGTQWVLRSPHPRTFMPLDVGVKLLASEAATLLYLKARSDIPVPEVFASSDNDNKVPFILMSEAPGWPLSKVWDKVMTQLGGVTWKLLQLRLDEFGSFYDDDGGQRGPFTTDADFYESLVSKFLEQADCLQLSHHCFVAPAVDLWNDFVTVGNKIDSADNRLDYIVAGDALRDIISPVLHTAFIDGFQAAMSKSTEESTVRKYRESHKRGKFHWNSSRLLGLDSIGDYNLFAVVWQSTCGPEKDIGEYFSQQCRSPHYLRLYDEVREEDRPLCKVERDEKDYFRNKTLMSEWKAKYTADSPRRIRQDMFVASPNLWKWIMQFMEDWEEMLDADANVLNSIR
ncbi:hypothetical protein BO83DRAFT_397224 [Aspergillus eucalypticola CBS 122712]|uniref:Aminoglycoside phosphotransferase domain-containing protein n=1 Tax=Aspergillus eucalypticola (strain CBS 122712 / IBT 29274) TaxID=1448314 RepID=A0A317VTW5_ASPEC|nr:uncharacterized protein BO83DRAFT_397224 [Aspergillus eucalypticola CBS 122712]PWY77773.1 hypothetical protein BO83DRAFT_397224 [Aspergillus eucalypticola CBS 122712]